MLVGWASLVGVLAVVAYSAKALGGEGAQDALYQWETAVAGLVQYVVVLGIAVAIGRRLTRGAVGLVRPDSVRRAAALALIGLGAIFALGHALDQFLEAGKEQGLLPDGWDGSRAAPFVANVVVVVLLAPFVEETVFRGLGYGAVRDGIGAGWAIPVTAIAFGLAHGLVIALPVLTAFGLILGWLRRRTGSIYPCVVLHSVFNGLALLAAVALGAS